MDPSTAAGHNVPSRHYWVTIARDSNFTTIVQQAYLDEPCYAPLSRWSTRARCTTGRSSRPRPTAFTRRRRHAGGFLASPSFQHASVPPTPISPVGGAAASGAVVFKWTPVPEQVKNYTIEVAQDDSFSTILESATTDATSYSANPTYPVGATVYWRVRANNNDEQGPRLVRDVDVRADAPGADDHDGRAVLRRDVPRAHVDARRRRHELRGAGRVAGRERAPDIGHPEHRGQLHEDDRHGSRHRAGARGLRERLKSAYTPARDVVHTIAEPGGTKTQLINKPGKLALTFAWNTKTNVKQYKVQVSRNPGFTAPFLDDTTDQAATRRCSPSRTSSTAASCTGASR